MRKEYRYFRLPQQDTTSPDGPADDTPHLSSNSPSTRATTSVFRSPRRRSSTTYRPRTATRSPQPIPESILSDLQRGLDQGSIRPSGNTPTATVNGMDTTTATSETAAAAAVEGTWTVISKKKKKASRSKRDRKGKTGRHDSDSNDEVTSSVFEPWVPDVVVGGDSDVTHQQPPFTSNHQPPLTSTGFAEILDSVRLAISQGMHPQPIARGSSGSYFCRDPSGKIVGVFKPNDEEPYGEMNQKWTKWMHRNFFPCFFGRSCLIPNIGYLSESAASLIDTRLGPLGIVPYTDVAQLASPSFQYPYLDRRAARPTKTRSARALPEKAGSFQCFLNEFRDATVFFRNHPWFDEGGRWNCFGEEGEGEGEGEEAEIRVEIGAEAGAKGARIGRGLGRGERLGRFEWTPALRRQFREQFERMVVLDYLIRNTDRGLDNWMVKYCSKNTVPASADPETQPPMTQMLASQVSATADSIAASASTSVLSPSSPANTGTPRPDGPSFASSSLPAAHFPLPHLHVAAIDNGLAFPYKHPDRWRSYPFGWTHLPHSLVAPPFSHATRAHFLPLLSDPRWWHDTIRAMRNLFAADAGFDEALFRRQVAVLKGQGWNLVKTLKDPRAGPLELVEMPRAVVWEEEVTLIVEEKVTPGQDATERGGEAVAVLGDAGAEGGEKPPDDPDVVSDGPVGAESAPDDDLSPSSERTGSASARSVRSGSTSVSSRDGAAADGRTTRKRWRDRIRRGLRIPVETTTRGEGGLERKATVVVERVQLVPDATPCFTWC